MWLLALAIAPGIALLIYIYLKDKYEPEPLRLVLKAFVFGGVSAFVILLFWLVFKLMHIQDLEAQNFALQAFYDAFIYAAVPEELVKFLVFVLFFFKIKDFNEWFDGIVYAVAISLGFATVENVFYVLEGGTSVGIMRSIFAVPSHFIDGVTQGFFISLAKFGTRKNLYLALALISAIVVHGVYDFLLFANKALLIVVFLFYFVGIVFLSKKLINKRLEQSQFK